MTENKDFEDVLKNLAGTQEDDIKDNKEVPTEAKEKIVYDPKESWQKESILNAVVGLCDKEADWQPQKAGIIKDILDDEHWFYIILMILGTQYRISNEMDASTEDLYESDSDAAKAEKINDLETNSLIDFAITNVIGETGRDKVFEKLQTKYPYYEHLAKHGFFGKSVLLEPHIVSGVKSVNKELMMTASLIKDESLSLIPC